MQRLWAPWRTVYIGSAGDAKGCIFCRAHRSRADTRNLILLRSRKSFVIMNRFPYSNGHLMVAPYRHVADIASLSQAEVLDLFALLDRCLAAVRKTMRPHGFNIGINLGRTAGAGVEDHIHIHLVPRWSGDTNFMPVLCKTKVISEALECTFCKLKKVL